MVEGDVTSMEHICNTGLCTVLWIWRKMWHVSANVSSYLRYVISDLFIILVDVDLSTNWYLLTLYDTFGLYYLGASDLATHTIFLNCMPPCYRIYNLRPVSLSLFFITFSLLHFLETDRIERKRKKKTKTNKKEQGTSWIVRLQQTAPVF